MLIWKAERAKNFHKKRLAEPGRCTFAEAVQQIASGIHQSASHQERLKYLMADALPFLMKALRVSPEELPYVHADLSTIYEDRGDVSQAIAEMKLALPVDVDGSYHYPLGRLYIKSGDRAAANEALNQAANLRRATDAAALFQK